MTEARLTARSSHTRTRSADIKGEEDVIKGPERDAKPLTEMGWAASEEKKKQISKFYNFKFSKFYATIFIFNFFFFHFKKEKILGSKRQTRKEGFTQEPFLLHQPTPVWRFLKPNFQNKFPFLVFKSFRHVVRYLYHH